MQVADEAAAVLIEVIQTFSSGWDSDTWQIAFSGPLSYLFELPKSHLAADEDETAVVSILLAVILNVHWYICLSAYVSGQCQVKFSGR